MKIRIHFLSRSPVPPFPIGNNPHAIPRICSHRVFRAVGYARKATGRLSVFQVAEAVRTRWSRVAALANREERVKCKK